MSRALLLSPARLHLMRLMPMDLLLKPAVLQALTLEQELTDVLPLIGTLLQYTDAFNYACLVKVRALAG